MLYLFAGSTSNKQLEDYRNFCTTLQRKRPEADCIHLTSDNQDVIQTIEHAVYKQGLFESKSIVTLNRVFDTSEIKNYIITHAQTLVASPNAFVCNEHKLSAKESAALTQAGATIYSYTNPASSKKNNLFYISDLLLAKKKSPLWVAFQQELNQGTSVEELVAIIIYQARALHHSLLSSQPPHGIKPFVYNKCRRSSWSVDEAQKLHLDLVKLYHESRRGGSGLDKKIEQLILTIN